MVPPVSDRAPPTPPYSGYGLGWRGFRVRGCHPLRRAFPGAFRYPRFFHVARPATPRAPRRPRFGLAPFRSPLLGGSLLFSFPPTTGMFRFVGFASPSGDAIGSQGRRRARQAAKGRGEARAAGDPRAPEWGNPPRGRRGIRLEAEANPANRNIQVAGGKENNSDPPSSGERKGASPNRGRRGARGVAGRATWKKRG